jgi:hypothetical protein
MLLYSCAQVELTVRDLGAARAFMQTALGATQAEQQLVKEIRALFLNGGYDIDHLNCGGGLFQFNEPSPAVEYKGQKLIHQVYLDRIGPCVTNLNFFVDDGVHAQELLAKLGAKTHIEGPSSASPSLANYGPENTRPGGDTRQFYFMGSRDLIGLDLEFMEPNFYSFSKQSLQYPCFVLPRPPGGDHLRLLRLRLVVRDLEETYKNLVTVFSPACRGKPYAVREGALARAFRIGLGGIELEYCQPLSKEGDLSRSMERYGPGVVTVEFGARDLDGAVGKVRSAGTANVAEQPDLLGFKGEPAARRYQIGSRDLVGFDVVLEKLDERVLAGNV